MSRPNPSRSPSRSREPAADNEQGEKPKPATPSSDAQHQPRTDAEIGEGGSLFDL